MDTESELHRKAVDQVAHLLASYDAGKLSAEAFRVGIETIWACLGGVVTLDAFQELMTEANAELRTLPPETHTQVRVNGSSLAIIMRTGEQVRMCVASAMKSDIKGFHIDDDAIRYARVLSETTASKGFTEISACA